VSPPPPLTIPLVISSQAGYMWCLDAAYTVVLQYSDISAILVPCEYSKF